MVSQSLRPDRIGIAVASAVGLVMSCYFSLEAVGAVSNLLGPRSLLLASLFSEKGSHVDGLSSSWVKAFAFGTALWASVATARRGVPPPTALRVVYGLSTLVFPVIIMLRALVVQPVFFDGFCVPCLLTALAALAIVECRRIEIPVAGPDPRAAPAPIPRGTTHRNAP